ncbi:hypothetical protein F5887DRAFT_952357 [Amanita rubescens]|nr:hypothetical protein F5887DRAFT_952357 [Amanita rubescens]
MQESTSQGVFLGLSIQDRLLSPLIVLVMVVGVVIDEFCQSVQHAFDTVFDGVSRSLLAL